MITEPRLDEHSGAFTNSKDVSPHSSSLNLFLPGPLDF